ncbi:hypothetical protein ACWGDS_16645 [Streptomyces sp. NPDC055059]
MLNPIDTAAVLRGGRAAGIHPTQIHAGVAWWLGACLVVTQQAPRLAVAHDGDPVSAQYAARLARGATNAQHYRCHVSIVVSPATASELLDIAHRLDQAPGAYITHRSGEVSIALFDAKGAPLTDESGLAAIRKLIDEDHVPIPVNDASRGIIVELKEDAS